MNLRYLLSSIALLAPCYWAPRIEAGDLSSHVYNAWLAELIARGWAPGLSLRPLWTNVLFDLELSALWRLGPAAAQRIAVAAAVLVFTWGAFAFASVVTRRRSWFMLPLVGVLAYGWVFHMGFFNFYLALGLGFWAMALAWRAGPARMIAAAFLLGLAATAHALPAAWAAGAIAYRYLARRVRPRHRAVLVAAAVALLAAARVAIDWRFPHLWYPQQFIFLTGSDQVWVYGTKYHLLQPVLLAIWGVLLFRLVERGKVRLGVNLPLQIALITAAGVVIIPDKILLPGYQHALVYIAQRMSLAVAILACVVLASARPRRLELASIVVFGGAYCAFLCIDAQNLNRIESRVERALADLPAGARVVSTLSEPDGRIDPLVHMLDRACVGRCFSYGNYEASTAQFRVRAKPGNPVVVSDYGDAFALQMGRYRVKPDDLPLYALVPVPAGDGFAVRPLEAREAVQMAQVRE
jgi:hypothetical protein